MASNTTNVVETKNPDVTKETTTETVDFRSPAGQGPVEKKEVEVIHQEHDDGSGTGVLGTAAAKVNDTIRSAKNAISGDKTVVETRNPDVTKETTTETVDFRSSAGQGQVEKKEVEVIHQKHDDGSGTGVLGTAVAKVNDTICSAKNAFSGDKPGK